jgi:hypothetical protein
VFGAAAVVGLALGAGDAPEPDEGGGGDPVKAKKPILVGPRTDANVRAYLFGEMRDFMRGAGVDTERHPVYEMTYMSKGKKAPDGSRYVAIPDRDYWGNLAEVFVSGVQPLEAALGFPLFVRGAYRASDYNKAVGGAPGSAHVIGNAVDLDARGPASGKPSAIERLKLAAARMFVDHPSWPMGLGIYSGNIHIDFMKRRTWEQAKKYVDRVKGIA